MPRRRGRRGNGGLTTRPNGKVQAVWSVTEGGKRTRQTKTFATRNEAEWWLKEAKRGHVPDDPLLSDYLPRWLAGKRRIRASTRALYASHIRVHISPALGRFHLSELRTRHVEAFVAALQLAPGTVGLVLRTLRAALAHGVRTGDLEDNPAAHVEAPEVRRKPVEAMTTEDALAVIDAVRGTWIEQLVRFLLGTGCRIGEACGLDQRDVGPGFVRVQRSKTTPRAVPCSDDAMAAVREAILAAPRRGPSEPVFFGPNGDRLRREVATHALPRLLGRAGVRRLTPHGLRHATATLMLQGGVPMRVIAEQLGHANPAVTARVYAHVVPESQRVAVGILDEAVRRR